ncbi:transposase [Streptomyces fimbriatus]|uniref:Transposase n=1 Tax=Streptomyces fimbriatus TaxID=68197 RepID=A0ABW0D2X4_STRFI
MSQTGAQSLDALTALQAASTRHVPLPGRDVAAGIVADTATQIPALDDRLKHIDQQIRQTFRTRPQAHLIESLPGTGPILGADFIVAAGDLSTYADAGRLASAAGLVPVPRSPTCRCPMGPLRDDRPLALHPPVARAA